MDTQISTVRRRPDKVPTKKEDSELKTFKDFLLIHGVYKEFCRSQGSWEAFKGRVLKYGWNMDNFSFYALRHTAPNSPYCSNHLSEQSKDEIGKYGLSAIKWKKVLVSNLNRVYKTRYHIRSKVQKYLTELKDVPGISRSQRILLINRLTDGSARVKWEAFNTLVGFYPEVENSLIINYIKKYGE